MSRSTDDTPLMLQYREIKARHRDAILFFRMGDFYEMFFDDAELINDAVLDHHLASFGSTRLVVAGPWAVDERVLNPSYLVTPAMSQLWWNLGDDRWAGPAADAREVLDDVHTRFGLSVIDPPIPKTVRFAEAPGRGVSILEHAPSSSGAQAYRAIAAVLHDDLLAGTR